MFIVQRLNILVQFTDLCVRVFSQVGLGGYWQFSCRIFYAQKLIQIYTKFHKQECVLKDGYSYRQYIFVNVNTLYESLGLNPGQKGQNPRQEWSGKVLNQQVLQSGEGEDFGEAGRENDSLANYV